MTTEMEDDLINSNAFREQQERDYEVMFGRPLTTMTTATSKHETLENAIGYLQEQKVRLSLDDWQDSHDYYGSMEAAQDILKDAQTELDD